MLSESCDDDDGEVYARSWSPDSNSFDPSVRRELLAIAEREWLSCTVVRKKRRAVGNSVQFERVRMGTCEATAFEKHCPGATDLAPKQSSNFVSSSTFEGAFKTHSAAATGNLKSLLNSTCPDDLDTDNVKLQNEIRDSVFLIIFSSNV